MTKQELKKMQRLSDKALPGPWFVSPEGDGVVVQPDYEGGPECYLVLSGDPNDADAHFVAAARTYIPLLIKRVRELERKLAHIQKSSTL